VGYKSGEMDTGSCSVVGVGISSIKILGSTTRELIVSQSVVS
jgi:hypothetical protein